MSTAPAPQRATSSASSGDRRLVLVRAALLAVVAGFSYSNSFDVPFHFDDWNTIVENGALRHLRDFVWAPGRGASLLGQTRYVGLLSFALNFAAHGTSVAGYHLVNLVIHWVNGLLVAAVALLLFRTPALSRTTAPRQLIALFAGLLFVAHPVQTQAVTYIAQRFTSLATLFYLVAVAAYLRGRLAKAPRASWAWSAASVVAAVLAMKTKEISFTLPLAVVVIEWLFFEGAGRRRWARLAPLLATLLIIPVSVIGLAQPAGDLLADVSAATRTPGTVSRWEYLLTQSRVVVTYLRLLAWPVGQNLDYDFRISRSALEAEVVASISVILSLLGLAAFLARRSRAATFPEQASARLVSLGIAWFFLALAVESSVIPITDVIFEHRLYLPLVGPCLALAACAFAVGDRLPRPGHRRVAPAAILTVCVAALAIATRARNEVWRSPVTLWSDVVSKSPMKGRGYSNLGEALYWRGELDAAVSSLRTSLALDPGNAQAHNNLATCYQAQQRPDEALQHFRRALALNPELADAHLNLGFLLVSRGSLDEGLTHLESAVRLRPTNAKARLNLGIAYKRAGRLGSADEQFRAARELAPELFDFGGQR